jgi:hypothetical protein
VALSGHNPMRFLRIVVDPPKNTPFFERIWTLMFCLSLDCYNQGRIEHGCIYKIENVKHHGQLPSPREDLNALTTTSYSTSNVQQLGRFL